ncbi:transporter family protein [Planifilum fulgidum]|jgi:transporter family protein|uniref:Transporter family protein n=1 Tax=Planifilum fulgidum TaxID=201973 RepID=A0A1I2RIY5_9BACL|nr:EamA family transporter [Planifilum fulgidum]MBO2497486.1 EamA family transporter [Bacillota bacterium]MBO2532588.1 EamA family transporter [Thermoactinomycetaceae bacterium]SFG38587.1 transporter family protein [Planifilum fulgidum]
MSKEIVYALLAALSFGIAPLFEKLGLARTDPTIALFIRAFVTMVFTLGFLVASGNIAAFAKTDFRSVIYVILGGVFGVLFAQYFYFRALENGEVGRVMPIVGSFPVVAFLFSVLVFGEAVTLSKVAGIILVVVGVILLGNQS